MLLVSAFPTKSANDHCAGTENGDTAESYNKFMTKQEAERAVELQKIFKKGA